MIHQHSNLTGAFSQGCRMGCWGLLGLSSIRSYAAASKSARSVRRIWGLWWIESGALVLGVFSNQIWCFSMIVSYCIILYHFMERNEFLFLLNTLFGTCRWDFSLQERAAASGNGCREPLQVLSLGHEVGSSDSLTLSAKRLVPWNAMVNQ